MKKVKHKWDETMTIAVLIASGLTLLLLLGSYISVTGEAFRTVEQQQEEVNSLIISSAAVLNQAEVVVVQDKRSRCDITCIRTTGKNCLMSPDSEDEKCVTKISKGAKCVCGE